MLYKKFTYYLFLFGIVIDLNAFMPYNKTYEKE